MELEMELEAANAIAREAVARRDAAERLVADAERQFVVRDRIFAASALFASVAHDIRSPLAALVLNLRIIEEDTRRNGTLGPDQQALFDDTRLACDLIEGVLDGLRTYATCSGVPRRLALRPIIECTVRLFRWHVSRRGVRLHVNVQGEPAAWGTTSEICQILLNLLANAAEASPSGGRVELTAGERSGRAFVRVDDEGDGLTGVDPEVLFAPFRSSKEHGLGIGLTVARAMARKHGGDLVLIPSVLGGASFELRLPHEPG